VIAAVGILVSLAGVAVAVLAIRSQGQALRRQLCVQTFTEYTRRYRELLAQVPEELLGATTPVDAIEQHKGKLSLLRTYFDLCFEEYYLYSRGFMDEDLWLLWRSGMEFAFSRPLVAVGWRLLKPGIQYPPEFVEFVEQRLAPVPK
jgi:hypothetical protein